MKRVLIDTDVILDFFFDREPYSENAAKLLSLCEKGIITGYVTPVIISNVYYILNIYAKHDVVLSKLKKLLLILEVLSIDKKAVILALNSEFKDFEDALQNYTAKVDGKIEVIITRNVKDYKKSDIAVFNPVEFLNLLTN
jgi:predicted nucleic acid-binding protein